MVTFSFQFIDGVIQEVGGLQEVAATFISLTEIRCPVVDLTFSYRIFISNVKNVSIASQTLVFLIFNSDCATCDAISETCIIRVSICVLCIIVI